MKLQQLRYLREVMRQNLVISNAADQLHTSQPGVSKQIRQLEEELGVDVFVRHGKRVVGITRPGQEILAIAERMLRDADNLKRVADEHANQDSGSLVIATTHTQARYALPAMIPDFLAQYPKVRLSLRQGSPSQICEMVVSGEADIAIATEAIDQYPSLHMLDCYEWNRSVVVPTGHPLLAQQSLSIALLAQYPLVTYDFAFAGRSHMNDAFQQQSLVPNVVLTAIDADVIKTYVKLGLGVGILASMAFDPEQDKDLQAIDASHLFAPSVTRIGYRKDAYLRAYMVAFILRFAPHLSRDDVLTLPNAAHK